MSACVMFSGKPLSNVAIIENVQPPASQSAHPSVAHRCPCAEGQIDDGREIEPVRHVEEAAAVLRLEIVVVDGSRVPPL